MPKRKGDTDKTQRWRKGWSKKERDSHTTTDPKQRKLNLVVTQQSNDQPNSNNNLVQQQQKQQQPNNQPNKNNNLVQQQKTNNKSEINDIYLKKKYKRKCIIISIGFDHGFLGLSPLLVFCTIDFGQFIRCTVQ